MPSCSNDDCEAWVSDDFVRVFGTDGSVKACLECGRSLGLVADDDIETARESIGFGTANDRLRSFCSVRCKARWLDTTARILETQQSTLALFRDGVDVDDAEAVTWAVA